MSVKSCVITELSGSYNVFCIYSNSQLVHADVWVRPLGDRNITLLHLKGSANSSRSAAHVTLFGSLPFLHLASTKWHRHFRCHLVLKAFRSGDRTFIISVSESYFSGRCRLVMTRLASLWCRPLTA